MVTTHHSGGSPALSYGGRISRHGRLVSPRSGIRSGALTGVGAKRGPGWPGVGGASLSLSWHGRARRPGDRAGWRVSPCLVCPASLALILLYSVTPGETQKPRLLPAFSFLQPSMQPFRRFSVDLVPKGLWNSSAFLHLTGSIHTPATTSPSLALSSPAGGMSPSLPPPPPLQVAPPTCWAHWNEATAWHFPHPRLKKPGSFPSCFAVVMRRTCPREPSGPARRMRDR